MLKSKSKTIYSLIFGAIISTYIPYTLAEEKPPIKIGVITPLTGVLSSYGKSQEAMVRMAEKDINEAGGINGSRLQIDISDSQTDPGQAVLLFRKYFNDGYFGVIGPMSGTQWETITPLANRLMMPAISVNAVNPGVTVRPWTLRMMAADDTLMPEGITSFLETYPNVKKVVITADVREASSKASADMYKKLAQDAGLEVLDTVEFSSKATDMSAVAIKIKSLNPDAIFAATFPAQAMLLGKDLAIQDVNVPILNTAILWTGPFINNIGEWGKNWHAIGISNNDGVPSGKYNEKLYKNIGKRASEQATAAMGIPFNVANWPISYDAVLFYADLLKNAGIDGNTGAEAAREAIKQGFVDTKEFEGAFTYSFRENGDAHIPAVVLSADIDNHIWAIPNEKK